MSIGDIKAHRHDLTSCIYVHVTQEVLHNTVYQNGACRALPETLRTAQMMSSSMLTVTLGFVLQC